VETQALRFQRWPCQQHLWSQLAAAQAAAARVPALTGACGGGAAETLASVQSALGAGAHLLDARAQPAQAPARAPAPKAMPSAPSAGAAQAAGAASQPVGAPATAPAAAASPGQAGLRGSAGPAHAPAPAPQPARAAGEQAAAPPAPPPVAPSPPPPPTAFATPAPPNAPLPDRPTFWWGTATAAFQVEGYVTADGRGVSIWDTFGATPGKTHNGDTGALRALTAGAGGARRPRAPWTHGACAAAGATLPCLGVLRSPLGVCLANQYIYI